jgi:hypothetical protein
MFPFDSDSSNKGSSQRTQIMSKLKSPPFFCALKLLQFRNGQESGELIATTTGRGDFWEKECRLEKGFRSVFCSVC